MKQDARTLTVQTVVLQHMARAAASGNAKALAGHALVYQAIVDRVRANT